MLLNILKAILARGLFAVHAFVTVWRVVTIKEGDTSYWLLTSSIGLLICEGVLSICKRDGREMKWFCPSVFLYLCCIIPPTWILELNLNETRKQIRSTNTSDIIGQRESLSVIPGLKLAINLEMSAELWAKVLEQILMVNLIVGRWLLPKGDLTRGQLSQLLLVYIGMAADIVELFEAFKEDVVIENMELTTAVLAIWSWSLMQFSLVLTATKARKPRLGMDSTPKDSPENMNEKTCCPSFRAVCVMDVWAILTTIIFQDGPFLCLRLLLIIRYNVVSYLNVFFTCKNSLVLVLQLYRMTVLNLETKGTPQSIKSDDVESSQQTSYKLKCDSGDVDTDCNWYEDELGYLSNNDISEPWRHPDIPRHSKQSEAHLKFNPDLNYNFLTNYLDPVKRRRKGPYREKTKDNHLLKHIDNFTDNTRDSICLVYSQSKDSPWSDVSLNLYSNNELAKVSPNKSCNVIKLNQNVDDQPVKMNDIAVQTSNVRNSPLPSNKKNYISLRSESRLKRCKSKPDEKGSTANNVKNCLKSKPLYKVASSKVPPSSYCMSTRF